MRRGEGPPRSCMAWADSNRLREQLNRNLRGYGRRQLRLGLRPKLLHRTRATSCLCMAAKAMDLVVGKFAFRKNFVFGRCYFSGKSRNWSQWGNWTRFRLDQHCTWQQLVFD